MDDKRITVTKGKLVKYIETRTNSKEQRTKNKEQRAKTEYTVN